MNRFFVKSAQNPLLIQMARYSASGFVAFSIDIGSLFLLSEYLGIHYLLAAIISFCLGILTIYYLSVTWVFNKRSFLKRHHEFGVFAVIGLIGLGLNELFIWIFTEFADHHYLVSKMIATILVYFWNFFNRKYILFH